MHDLVRTFGRALITAAEKEIFGRRHASYFLVGVSLLREEYEKGGVDSIIALQVLDFVAPDVWAAQAWAVGRIQTDEEAAHIACDLARLGAGLWLVRLSAQDRRRWNETALAAARTWNDPGRETAALGNLAAALVDLGDLKEGEAHHRRALELAESLEDRSSTMAALSGLAKIKMLQGAHREATRLLRRELRILRSTKRPAPNRLVSVLDALGVAAKIQDRWDRALRLYRLASQVPRTTNISARASLVGNMANLHYLLNNQRLAAWGYREQLRLARLLHDANLETNALLNFGIALMTRGKLQSALICYARVLDYDRRTHNKLRMAATLYNLANAEWARQSFDQAFSHAQEALALAAEFGLSALHDRVQRQLANWDRRLRGG